MRRYTLGGLNARRNGFFLLFLVYLLVAALGMKFHERKEFFPVFSWSLFTYVWEHAWGYEVEITRIDDQVFDPPRNYFEFPHVFAFAAMRDNAVVKAASAFASVREKTPGRDEDLRAALEDRYLAGPKRVD